MERVWGKESGCSETWGGAGTLPHLPLAAWRQRGAPTASGPLCSFCGSMFPWLQLGLARGGDGAGGFCRQRGGNACRFPSESGPGWKGRTLDLLLRPTLRGKESPLLGPRPLGSRPPPTLPLPRRSRLRGRRLRARRLPRRLQRPRRVRARRVPLPRGLHVRGLQRAALPGRLQRPRLLRHGRVLLRGGLRGPGLRAG